MNPAVNFSDLNQRRFLGIYLRTLAIIYAWGLLIHLGNFLGYGDTTWIQMPSSWKTGNIYLVILDVAVVIGLWKRRPWGVACFVLSAVSRLIVYLGFPDVFAVTEGQKLMLRDLISAQIIALTIFFGLLVSKK